MAAAYTMALSASGLPSRADPSKRQKIFKENINCQVNATPVTGGKKRKSKIQTKNKTSAFKSQVIQLSVQEMLK